MSINIGVCRPCCEDHRADVGPRPHLTRRLCVQEGIRHLNEQIAKEEAKLAHLRARADQRCGAHRACGHVDVCCAECGRVDSGTCLVASGSDVGDPQEKVLTALLERTTEVFRKCGFDAGANPTTLSMLTALEVCPRCRTLVRVVGVCG